MHIHTLRSCLTFWRFDKSFLQPHKLKALTNCFCSFLVWEYNYCLCKPANVKLWRSDKSFLQLYRLKALTNCFCSCTTCSKSTADRAEHSQRNSLPLVWCCCFGVVVFTEAATIKLHLHARCVFAAANLCQVSSLYYFCTVTKCCNDESRIVAVPARDTTGS